MIIESKQISGNGLTWTLRCPTPEDASELSKLRVQIDGETEYLDREEGEGYLSPEDFGKIISEDRIADRHLFLIAEINGTIVGFTRCIGYDLKRFQHKADFGICILKDHWGYGIGKILLEAVINWASSVNITKIALTVVANNTYAIQLYKKYGFVEEGLLIKDRIHRDGNYYDTVIMGRYLN